MMIRLTILALVFFPSLSPAAPPPDVWEFVSTMARDLAGDNFDGFIRHFDPAMPGYNDLKEDAASLLGIKNVESEIDVISDSGDAQTHTLELDWVLITGDKLAPDGTTLTRRFVVKCTLKRERKTWKVVSFDPVRLFKL